MNIKRFLPSVRLRRAIGVFALSIMLGLPMFASVIPAQAACMSQSTLDGMIPISSGTVNIDLAGCTILVDGTLHSGGPYDGPGPTALRPIASGVTVRIFSSTAGGEIQRSNSAAKIRIFSVRPGGRLELYNITVDNGVAQGGKGGAPGSDGVNVGGGGGGGSMGGNGGNAGVNDADPNPQVTGGGGGGGGSLHDGGNGVGSTGGTGGLDDGGNGGSSTSSNGGAGTMHSGGITFAGTGVGGGGGADGNGGKGGVGGFGGGGGGRGYYSTSGTVAGGFGGGDGGSIGFPDAGGGGGGFGGAVIVDTTGILVTHNVKFSNNTATGGDAGDNGSSGHGGSGYGSAIFSAGQYCDDSASPSNFAIGNAVAGGTAPNHNFNGSGHDTSTGYYAYTGSTTGCTGIPTFGAPSMTTQPVAQSVCLGSQATFTAAASGGPTPDEQWQVQPSGGGGFTNINGETGGSYIFTPTTADNGKTYQAVFSNALGTTTSNAVGLTVNTAPSVGTNPTSQTVNAGQNVTLNAATSGSPTPTVQWYVSTDGGQNFNPISGATSTSYSFIPAASDNGNQYYAVFSNSCNASVQTTTATLTVHYAPSITTDPTSQAVCENAPVTFTAAASGNPTPTGQWQVSTGGAFSDISGATGGSYTHNALASENGYQYRDNFTNSVGSTASNAATLTVNTAPQVTTNPTSQGVNSGQPVTFTAAASGSPTPTVQWQVSVSGGPFTDISGATGTTYTFTASLSDNGNQYRAVFSNSCNSSVQTTAATLTVTGVAPTISTNPTSQTVCENTSVTFPAAADGVPVPTAQWQVSTGGPFSDISGATNPNYTFTAHASDTGKQYQAVFTNVIGSATTSAATLTVNTVPVVTTNPTSQNLVLGTPVTFTAAASGIPTPTVRWQVGTGGNFSDIGGQTGLSYTFTPTLADSGKQYRAVFTNLCNASVPTTAATLTVKQFVLTPTSLPAGRVGTAYNQTISGTNGTPPYHNFQATGTVPPGLTLDGNGHLTGTPTGGGTFTFSVTAQDSSATPGPFSSPARGYTVTIATPTVTLGPSRLNTMKVGVPFSQTLTVSGGTIPYTFSLTGALPTGLNLNTSTGEISGTPTATGAFSFTITVRDSSVGSGPYSSAPQVYGAKIDPPTVALSPASLPGGKVGTAYNQTVSAAGGTTPYTYTVSGGNLPAGLSLNASSGQISGTPTTAASSVFAITATDSTGGTGHATASKIYTVVISN